MRFLPGLLNAEALKSHALTRAGSSVFVLRWPRSHNEAQHVMM